MTDEELVGGAASKLLATALRTLAESGVREAIAAFEMASVIKGCGWRVVDATEREFYAKFAGECEEMAKADMGASMALASRLSEMGHHEDAAGVIALASFLCVKPMGAA